MNDILKFVAGGANIGDNLVIYNPRNVLIDQTSLMYIEIGNDVQITSGVIILAHDFSYSVVARAYRVAPRKQRVTHIGNNVFLGMNTIVLMGANIGDNVIIGAGSVVHGVVESNSVYAGNPARKICDLSDYIDKANDILISSSQIVYDRFIKVKGRKPELEDLGFYKALLFEKTDANMEKYFKGDILYDAICKIPKKFDSVDEMIGRGNVQYHNEKDL